MKKQKFDKNYIIERYINYYFEKDLENRSFENAWALAHSLLGDKRTKSWHDNVSALYDELCDIYRINKAESILASIKNETIYKCFTYSYQVKIYTSKDNYVLLDYNNNAYNDFQIIDLRKYHCDLSRKVERIPITFFGEIRIKENDRDGFDGGITYVLKAKYISLYSYDNGHDNWTYVFAINGDYEFYKLVSQKI